MRIVVYTAIIGGYDELKDPSIRPEGVDFVCFSDRPFTSDTWNVRVIKPRIEDQTRASRHFKILPHHYLREYDYSIWVDGNIDIIGDVREQINDAPMRVYNHMHCADARDCIYDEARAIIAIGAEKNRKPKESREKIEAQAARYLREGYPSHNGLICGTILYRRHNDHHVIEVMEDWWREYSSESKRDQMSFNYVAWKHGFEVDYLEGDVRDNNYFKRRPHFQASPTIMRRTMRKARSIIGSVMRI